MWTGNTNTSQGIDKAAGTGEVTNGVLTYSSPNGRSGSTKIIVLISDGQANIRRNADLGSSQNEIDAIPDTIQAATDAAALGIRVYTIGVGFRGALPSVQQFLQDVAQAGGGTSFIASPDPAVYHTQLLDLVASLPQ
jgi:hypothetical protein